jgi:hypothetical protein
MLTRDREKGIKNKRYGEQWTVPTVHPGGLGKSFRASGRATATNGMPEMAPAAMGRTESNMT